MVWPEDLKSNAAVLGLPPDRLVTVVNLQWFGSEPLELPYKGLAGREANELLYHHDGLGLEVVEQGHPRGYSGDGLPFRLLSNAHRMQLAHLFDPSFAVRTPLVDRLPRQIRAIHEAIALKIKADIPHGMPDNVVRAVPENRRTLQFTHQGFESE